MSEEIRPVSHEHPQLRELRCSLFLLMVSNISNTSRTYDQSITFFLPSPQASKYFRELSLIKYLMIMVSNISESDDHSPKLRLPSHSCSSKKSRTVAANYQHKKAVLVNASTAIDIKFLGKTSYGRWSHHLINYTHPIAAQPLLNAKLEKKHYYIESVEHDKKDTGEYSRSPCYSRFYYILDFNSWWRKHKNVYKSFDGTLLAVLV